MNQAPRDRSFFTHHAAELARLVEAGDVRAVARVITQLENRDPTGAAVLTHVAPSLNRAFVIGITGYPGTGKSTLIDQLIAAYRRLGQKVGVLAVDVSSPVTGGAVLGDRIRMQQHTDDPQVYIRSMATRGHQGGLAPATSQAIRVLDAAGYGVIVVETVGVGQNELDVMHVVHTVIAVVAPGLGDDVQAMKAGLLEIADIVVVNKGDREGADAALRDLRECCKTVIRTVAVKGDGIAALIAVIAEHERWRDLDRPELHKRRGFSIDRGSRAG